ncbi:MAG: hypothetical protein CVU91_12155 [Firmicutes bacterium HGW-Firmicutes-16]|nr:MAG: hypothetical protein CVU91_12155 [Firmicutes bacterium HGW-Firmicutes-16]
MKKLLTLMLALAMCFALVACGTPATPTTSEEPVASTEPATEAAGGEETAAIGDWYDYADIFTTTLYGLSEAGEPVVFVMNDAEDFAVLAVVDPDTMESVSFVGEMTLSEDGLYTITDTTSELALTFSAEFYEDGSVALDMGDLGALAVMPCEQSEAFDLLNEIDASTTSVA